MKRFLLVSGLLAAVILSAAVPAFAQDYDAAPGATCGEYFGAHVADHADDRLLTGEHNPGMHEGLADFGDHSEEMTCP